MINHGKWKLFFDSELHDFGGAVIFKGNLNKDDLANLYIYQTPLQKKVWSEINYDDNITSTESLRSLPLWQNYPVRIGSTPIYYKSRSRLPRNTKVRYLMKDADNLLSFTEFKKRFEVKTIFFCQSRCGIVQTPFLQH